MVKLLLMFTVPVFPFSLLVDYVRFNCERCRDYLLAFLVLSSLFLVNLSESEAGGLLKFLALATSIGYTVYMVYTKDLVQWAIGYYIASATLSWFNPEKMFFYLVVLGFPLIALNFLILHLKRFTNSTHLEDLKGIASEMPTLSFFTVASLLASVVVAPAYNFIMVFKIFGGFNIVLSVIFLTLWVLWIWSSFKLYPYLFFEHYEKEKGYGDISSEEAFPIAFLILVSILFPFFANG